MSDMFEIALAIAKNAGELVLQAIPKNSHGVREILAATPDGHYFRLNSSFAYLYIVGPVERAPEFYAALIPGYSLAERLVMTCERPDLYGRFVLLRYERNEGDDDDT